MKSIPGYKPWHASFMGFTTQTDWDHTNGGVIMFDDGTIWSYDCEGPINGDGVYYWNYPDGLAIVERKPSTGVWERLTPDLWGLPSEGQPPGYPLWPSNFTTGGTGEPEPWEADFSGPLNVARIGDYDNDWRHIHDGDDVWFYSENNDGEMGLVKVNRHTRIWERFITTQATLDIYNSKQSRIVLSGEYFWFLGTPSFTDPISLYRADKSNPDNVVLVHTWGVPDRSDTNTWNLDVAAWLEPDLNDYYSGLAMTIDDDGYMYIGGILSRGDERSVYNGPNDDDNVQYDLKCSFMKRCKMGDYDDFELLLWHSNQGFVGYMAAGSYNYGNYYWGTVGIDTEPGAFNSERTDEPRGMGFYPAHWHDMEYRDGWLYWIDQSGHWGGAYGTSKLLCRMRIADYTSGTPTKHDPLNPSFEVIGNGTVPWEGNAGHLTRYGDFNFWFDGAAPVLPYPDNTMTFDSDGNLIWKCITFPGYQSAGGSPFQFWPPEYPHRALIRLSPPVNDEVNVTMTFTGTSLTGYGNVREVQADNIEIILELGGATNG